MSEDTNRLAVATTQLAVLEMEWFFREQDVSDQGIDAHIEKFVRSPGADGKLYPTGTGRLLAVQIKGGPSYFDKRSKNGWWFEFNEKKRKFWRDHALPVIVVLVDLDGKQLYWQRISNRTVQRAGKGFKVNVPASQTVTTANEVWTELANGLELDAVSRFDYSLLHLPPSVSSELSHRTPEERADAAVLAMYLAQGRKNPWGTASSLLATRPFWIESNPAWGWPAVSNYAIAHELGDLAAEAALRAAENAAEGAQATLLATTAILFHSIDPERAAGLLERASSEAAAAGSEPILLAVARTIMSRPAGDGDPWDVDPILLSGNAEVSGSAPAQRTLVLAAQQRRDLDKAIQHARGALEAEATSTETMFLLARLLLARWSAKNASADLDAAIGLLRDLIAQRRHWDGPTQNERAELARALLGAGRLDAALDLTLVPPFGTADPDDLDPRCVRIAALAAHHLGKRDALDEAVGLLSGGALDQLTKHRVGAINLSSEQIHSLRLEALEMAVRESAYEDIVGHSMALISDGVDVRDRLKPYVDQGIASEDLLVLANALLLARTDLDAALPELRELARTNAIAAEELIGSLRRSGRYREAADEAHALYELTHSGTYLIHRANALIAAGAADEAATAATEAIQHATGQPFEIAELLTYLGTESAKRGDWATAETHFARVLDLSIRPSDDQIWRLVSSMVNQGRIARAARVVGDRKPQVRNLAEAWLWYRAHATMPWDERIALDAYAFADRFNDPELSVALLSHIIQGTRGLEPADPVGEHEAGPDQADARPSDPDLERRRALAQPAVSSEIHRGAFDMMGRLSEQFGDAAGLTILKGSTEELLEKVVESLRRNADDDAAIMDLVRQARDGQMPVGFLAAMLGKSVTTFVLQRALGVLVASPPDNDEHDSEVKAAREAIGGKVAVDTTTVATLTGLTAPHRLTGRYVSLLVSPGTMFDFHRAAFDVRGMAGSPGTLSWDPQRSKLVLTELGEEEFSRLWHRAERLEAFTDRLAVSSIGERHLGLGFRGDPAHAAWTDVLELAAAQGLRVWSDDLALRRVARSLGIEAFSTSSVADAIREAALETSRTSDSDEAAIQQAAEVNLELARDFIVDVPISRGELLRLAAEDGWQGGCAAAVLSRPAWWAGNAYGITTLREIYREAKAAAPSTLPVWQSVAMSGIGRALPPQAASPILAAVTLMGFGPGSSDQQLADSLHRARQVAAEIGYPDPAGALLKAAQFIASIGECDNPVDLVNRVMRLAEGEPGPETV